MKCHFIRFLINWNLNLCMLLFSLRYDYLVSHCDIYPTHIISKSSNILKPLGKVKQHLAKPKNQELLLDQFLSLCLVYN